MLDAPSQILSCKSVGYAWLWRESFNSMNSFNQERFGPSVTSYTPTNQFPKSHQWATVIWTTCETGKSLLWFVFLDLRHKQCPVSCKGVLYYASCIMHHADCTCRFLYARIRMATSDQIWYPYHTVHHIWHLLTFTSMEVIITLSYQGRTTPNKPSIGNMQILGSTTAIFYH